ncbi:MAG: 2-dehydro-3-deoxyphosphogluconate aldolase [Candidatus Chloroheliales bacterium]|nr:MAG: 2-dehydro-3-deoxyphosphogluconate aldolase [Chloroflexota bacterium]
MEAKQGEAAGYALARIERERVMVILRGLPTAATLHIGAAMLAGGISAIEMTMNSERPLDSISALREKFGDEALIGAGTVLSPAQARASVQAGAQFLVSPNLDAEVMKTAAQLGVLMIPGVMTPTELAEALKLGASLVKVFPARVLGPDYFRALLGPFRGVHLAATGLPVEACPDFLRAGARAVAVGDALLDPGLVAASRWGELTLRARKLVADCRI